MGCGLGGVLVATVLVAGHFCQSCQDEAGIDRQAVVAVGGWAARPAADLGAVVARVGDQTIHASEVAAQALRFGVPPTAALDQLVRFALLAERAGASADPATASDRSERRLLVERLLEQEFEPSIARARLPDEELRGLYQRFEHTFVHPRLVEVALLSVYTGPTMKPEPRERARVTARDLIAYVSKREVRTAEDFEAISKDPAWADRKVKYWRLVQGPSRKYGPFGETVGGALQKLQKPNETSPLIEDDSGYHIARYIGEMAPRNVPFEAAREELVASYYPAWRKQRFIAWSKGLGIAHKVEVFPDHLQAAIAR